MRNNYIIPESAKVFLITEASTIPIIISSLSMNPNRPGSKFSQDGHKAPSSLIATHHIVINFSFQKRDTLPDLFSRTFSFSRGFEALNTRRMYKLGGNYHFPLIYPDLGVGNIFFIQRIRANAFYDFTRMRARLSGILTDFNARSTGGELYLDGKIWNSYPVSIGFRVSHLLDTDLVNPTLKNKFEVILPIGLVPR
jgi:hypothetical protein